MTDEHSVGVKAEYIIKFQKSAIRSEPVVEVSIADVLGTNLAVVGDLPTEIVQTTETQPPRDNRHDNRSSNEAKGKKRPRDARPAQNERLCSYVVKGLPCAYGASCRYDHDVAGLLSRKPADIGPECYQYNVYGWCPHGILCRFGSKHTDMATGKSIVRSDSEGGVKGKVLINTLSRSLQTSLRKRTYDFNKVLSDITSRAVTVMKPDGGVIDEDIEEPEVSSSSDDKKAKLSEAPVSNIHEDDVAISTSAAVDMMHVHTQPKHDVKTASSEPYDDYVKLVDFSNKVYVAPLTTVGNLPFRRILKEFGADITCGEMALTENIQAGQPSEWALMRRHSSEDIFGVQVTGAHVDQLKRVTSLIRNEVSSDFIDLNCGCPIDLVCNRGCGASLMNKQTRLLDIVSTMIKTSNRSITVKIRTGWDEKNPSAHKFIPELQKIASDRVAALMIHGRSRLQRYSRLANWDYILQVAQAQNPNYKRIPVVGNGDIFSYDDWKNHQSLIRQQTDDMDEIGLCSCAMIGRGAIIKPWLPVEIKEQRHFDISASERMDILQRFCNYGMEHWGSDQQGINTTRRFLLEWLSFLYKYVPVGITERVQTINQRPPLYFGRCDTETLLASAHSKDWVKISEMFLGSVPDGFAFQAKHKSNSYSADATESVSNG